MNTITQRLRHLLPLALALGIPACALSDDGTGSDDPGSSPATEADTAPHTSEATSALVNAGWNGVSQTQNETWQAAQVATINGVTYAVSVGNCGSTDCYPFGHDTTQMRWSKMVNGVWQGEHDISGQKANTKANLAAFNGYLYMVHTGEDDSTAAYMSRFDPTTETWTSDHRISYPTFGGPPAIAAFNGKLYFIGTTGYPYSMWYGTMDTNEGFTPQVFIPGHDGASRPSATVGFGKLWFAHRWGQTGDIVYGTFDGTTWSPATHIYGGVNNGPIQGLEPVIAYDQNIIHLVHRRPNATDLWWQTFNGCQWATTETSLGTQQSSLEPSLAQGGPGLVMITDREFDDLFGLTYYTLDSRTYTHASIFRAPICGIIGFPVNGL